MNTKVFANNLQQSKGRNTLARNILFVANTLLLYIHVGRKICLDKNHLKKKERKKKRLTRAAA